MKKRSSSKQFQSREPRRSLGSPFKASSLNEQAQYFNDAKSSAGGGWLLIIHKVIVGDRLNAMPKRPKVKSSSLRGKKMRVWIREENPVQ